MIKTGPKMTAGRELHYGSRCWTVWMWVVTTNEHTDEWLLSFLEVSHGAI